MNDYYRKTFFNELFFIDKMRESYKSIFVNKISLSLSIMFAGLAGYSFFAFFPIYLSNRAYADGEITFIMTFMGIGIAGFSSYFGRISDTIKKRKVFLVGGLVGQLCIFVFLMIFNINDIINFCLLTFLRGVSLAARIPASNALFADIVEKKNNQLIINSEIIETEVSGRQLSLLNIIKSTGWGLGLIFSNIFMTLFGAESLIQFLLISTIISLLFAFCVNDHIEEGEEIHENIIKEKNSAESRLNSKKNDDPNGKVNNLLYLCIFLRQFGVLPFLQIIALILLDAEIDPSIIGIIIAINPLCQILTMFLLGRLIDKSKVTERLILSTGFSLTSISLMLYMIGQFFSSPLIFILGQINLALAWGCIQTGANKYIINKAPRERAKYLGYFLTSMQVAKIISYLIFAGLLVFFSYQIMFPFAMLIPLIAAIIVFWL
ncbi:MAG: MFS transporter [Promethearchaeota archaeon]